jgi:hypothetical protein
LKITSSQLPATSTPSWTSWPTGVCIHELRARIQKADTVVPNATTTADITCTHPGTRFMPNSITPRNVASRKNAVRIS